jgi:hypothetical protein
MTKVTGVALGVTALMGRRVKESGRQESSEHRRSRAHIAGAAIRKRLRLRTTLPTQVWEAKLPDA